VFDRLEMTVLFEIASKIPAQDVGYYGGDVAGGRRTADRRNGPPRRRRQVCRGDGTAKIEGKMLPQNRN